MLDEQIQAVPIRVARLNHGASLRNFVEARDLEPGQQGALLLSSSDRQVHIACSSSRAVEDRSHPAHERVVEARRNLSTPMRHSGKLFTEPRAPRFYPPVDGSSLA